MRIGRRRENGAIQSFCAILYADDTLLCADSAKENQAVLCAVEDVSGVFGLKLNKKKCPKISARPTEPVIFKDGTKVEEVTETEYLGGVLTHDGDARKSSKNNPSSRKVQIPVRHILEEHITEQKKKVTNIRSADQCETDICSGSGTTHKGERR